SGTQLGGQGWRGHEDPNPRTYFSVGQLVAEQSYKWKWENVNHNNGVQLWMPFSEGSILGDCPPPAEPPATQCDQIRFTIPDDSRTTPSGSSPDRRHFAV